MSQEDLLSLEDVVQILSVSRDRIDSWIEQGILSPVRTGASVQFQFDEVRALVQEHLPSPGHGLRILVIEDDRLVGSSLRNLLEKSGYETQVVPLGLAALDRASEENFDLILSDVRMPGMNGIETLKAVREVRARFGRAQVPEIILTAYEDPEVREEARRLGVREFMLKPFEFKELIAAVERNVQHAA